MDRLGIVLKDACLQAGRTQKEIAVKAGVTGRHIMNIDVIR